MSGFILLAGATAGGVGSFYKGCSLGLDGATTKGLTLALMGLFLLVMSYGCADAWGIIR